ncbi:MAG TPA: histidine kinase [Flavitalea sp.]|nr:histidine kinase [Flavitalea sp.]
MISATNYSTLVSRIPKYTKNDTYLFWGVVPLLTLLLNFSLFGYRFFSDITIFLTASFAGFLIVSALWFLLNRVAVLTKSHFSRDGYPFKRIFITICLYVIITALFSTILRWAYDSSGFFGYNFNEKNYRRTLVVGIILSIFITLLHEGVTSFSKWKATMIETEQLKKEYMQSQLLGLKSQVNPHFLFNSLNSLSSLISENQAEAEKFLDEMSKVYRYLLRNTDDQLVTLETELQFVRSYFYLLKSRYSEGINLVVEVDEPDWQMTLPPLTLQMLVEAAYNQNTVNRDRPLTIEITSVNNGWLRVKNNIEKKIADDPMHQSGLENVANKFRLLCQQSIIINKSADYNIIELPLIPQTEISMA